MLQKSKNNLQLEHAVEYLQLVKNPVWNNGDDSKNNRWNKTVNIWQLEQIERIFNYCIIHLS